jgi:hypothetical protein
MPNQHHPDKEVLGFYLDRRLAQKLRRAARTRSIPITEYLKEVLSNATSNIHLTEEDRREIAERKARKLCRPFTRKHRPKATKGRQN